MDRVDGEIRMLMPQLPGASLAVAGGINRYPLEPVMALPLLPTLHAAAQQIGVVLPEAVRSGGGSDGNLTAGIGVPTLDGLGAVGGHPHARNEWVDVTAMPQRAELLVVLVDRLCAAADAECAATGAGQAPA
jgi:glutamate carboxypeptidase